MEPLSLGLTEDVSLLNHKRPRSVAARRSSKVLHASKSSFLRGVPVSAVLNTRGELLYPAGTTAHSGTSEASAEAAEDGADDTYALSIPTARICFFISHNWENSLQLKFLAIL